MSALADPELQAPPPVTPLVGIDMSYGNYALIIVDCQYDFLPGGALAVPDGDKVLFPIASLAPGANLVVASRDWHPEDHFSFADEPTYSDGSWPVHCVQGTKGARIHTSVRKYAHYTISKGMNRNPPDAYSAFAGKTLRPVSSLEEILQRSPIQTVVVTGLAFDYCVRYTALDAAALGYRTVVPGDAIRGVDDHSSEDAMIALERAGVELVEHFVP